MLEALYRICIVLAVCLGMLGQFITFIPGGNFEYVWFLIAAGVAIVGVFSKNIDVRLVAILVAAIWFGDAMMRLPR